MCKTKIKIHNARIVANKTCAKDHFYMELEVPELAKEAVPGQFVNVQVRAKALNPLLRIPMGIHKINKKGISLLYKVVGEGTGLLSDRKKDEEINILGPLGKGFDITFADGEKKEEAILVAGGHGAAPIYALAAALVKKKKPITVLLGARTGGHLVCVDEFRKTGATVRIATEDGSRGHKGYVTEILKEILKKKQGERPPVFACGPRPMLAAIAADTKKGGERTQVSLDAYMACGIGACLGCAIRTVDGYKLVCKDGPVFGAAEIDWKMEGKQ